MDTRKSQYNDNLLKKVDGIELNDSIDLARVIPLYIKILNDNSVVNNVSLAYIDNYDGKSIHKKYGKYFIQLHEMFNRNGLMDEDKRIVFKKVAQRVQRVPTTIKGMKYLNSIVIEETHNHLKYKKSAELRKNLISKFKLAIKKYFYLTYTLGFNEPSLCAKTLATTHKIDKYILSGDFPLLLLPFLPDVEDTIKKSYENYIMKDAWEVIKGQYFNKKDRFMTLSLEIKSNFTRNIVNFSEYFDKLYSDNYYRIMLGKKK